MTVEAGAPAVGRLAKTQGISGTSPGGVILPGSSLVRGGGTIVERVAVTKPIIRGSQTLPPPGWYENEPGVGKGEEGKPLFAATAEGIKEYEEFLKGFVMRKFKYFALGSAFVDPAEKWYLMIPLIESILQIEKVDYGGPLNAGAEGEPPGRPFEYWYNQYVAGSTPTLYIAWSPTNPGEYKDHFGNPSLDPDSEALGSRTLLPPGSEGPFEIPLSWLPGGTWDPTCLGTANYTPESGDIAYDGSEEAREKFEEEALAFSEMSFAEQEKTLKELALKFELEKEALEKAEHIENEEEVRKKELEERYHLFFPKPLEPPWGPYPQFHTGLFALLASVSNHPGDLSSHIPEAVEKKILPAAGFKNRTRWGLRIPLASITEFTEGRMRALPSTGYFVFYLEGQPGDTFQEGSGLGELYSPELQKLEGATRKTAGTVLPGAQDYGRVIA